MPLSTIDLEKLENYKLRQQSFVLSNSANSNSSSQNSESKNEENLPDLISWCVEDIVGKMDETEDFLELNNEQKNNFEINLRMEFLDDFVDKFEVILSKDIKTRIEFLKIGKKIENLEQIIQIINEIILVMPVTKELFFKTIKTKYLGFCEDLGVSFNKEIVFAF